jgi:hypothetical protein
VTEAAGTLADEAAKLFSAAEAWWREHAPAAPEEAAAECRYCPFCQALSVVRGAQPELVEQVTEAANGLFTALRNAAEATAHRKRDDVPVERIDIA